MLDLGRMQLPPTRRCCSITARRSTPLSVAQRISGATVTQIIADCRISAIRPGLAVPSGSPTARSTGISIGYSVPRWQETRSASGERTRIAIGAILRHAALVAEPADEQGRHPQSRDDDLDGDRQRRSGARCPDAATMPARSAGRANLIDRAVAERWDDQRIMEHTRDRSGRIDIRTTSHVSLDDPEVHRTAMRDNLVARMAGIEAQGPARELQSLSWPEMHRRHLRNAGQSVAGLSDQEVIVRALSTTDMPIIAGARSISDQADILTPRSRRSLPCLGRVICRISGRRVEALVDWTTLSVGKVGEMGEFRSSYVTESGEKSRSTRSAASPA